MSTYIYWNEKLEIRKYMTGILVLVVKRDSHEGIPTKKNMQTYTLNDTSAEIIQLIDGTKTYNEIISFLSLKYNENRERIEEKMKSFIQKISNLYDINISTQSCPRKAPVNIISKKTIYPKVASIELTNKCNIRCLHCYGNFGEIKSEVMSLSKSKTLLDDLKNMGVQLIELTGGEITVHPNIKEILLHAVNLNFDQISFLTNGIALSDDIIDILIKNRSKIYVQIDLHSLDDNYLKWFTKVPNTLNLIKSNIIKLSENNVRMRIATIITRKNMDEIEDIADWVHNLGIKNYGISPVISLGRAINSDSNLFLNEDDAYNVNQKLEKINKKYKKFLSIVEGDRSRNKNCGCLTPHVVIASTGDIKICTMDNLKYFNSSIGNVFEKNIKDIYDDNVEYINTFFNMSAPQFDSLECKECKNKYFCSNCLLRGLVKASEMNGKCLWYNNIPKIIKEKLSF
ncbi:radical SAM protein [Clostridium sp. DL1XJH146]